MACLLATLSGHAHAAGAWATGGQLAPIEQRVAIAAGPARTTLWTSLRFEASPGNVGLVLPIPAGATIDVSSDAWFEALEVATAPRVFPPPGASPYCPGISGPKEVFEVAGDVSHTASLAIEGAVLLADAPAVSTWASQHGLALAPDVEAKLGAMGDTRFLAVRFLSSGSAALTPTLRVTMPGQPPMLPLALTRAGADDLRVTTWLLGAGRGATLNTSSVAIPPGKLAWKAGTQLSNYVDLRADQIDAESPYGALYESAGHASLSENVSIAAGTAAIDGVVTTFFERAAAYGDATLDPSMCIGQAAAALASNAIVSTSCPRADLGGDDDCVESPTPGGVDPDKLRCGGVADDLAIALSGLTPASVWLTRETLQIPAGHAGQDWAISFGAGPALSPVKTATSLDVGDCSGQSSSNSSSSSSSTGTGWDPGGWEDPTSSSGSGGWSGGSSGNGSSSTGSYTQTSCACSGNVGIAGDADSCSGSTEDSGTDSCSGDTASDSCDGDAVDADSCDGGDMGSDSCDGGDMGDVDCSGGGDLDCDLGADDCSVSGRRAEKHRAPRLSPIALALLAIVAPLRRRGRRSRRAQA